MRTQKGKLETRTDTTLQLLSEDSAEESAFTSADDYTKVALERKNEDSRPIYLKRI